MIPQLPFSGLSLLIHLGIILFAFIVSFLGFEDIKKEPTTRVVYSRRARLEKTLASLTIIVFVAMLTIAFTFTAIGTAIKVGSDEPQRIFLKKALINTEKNGTSVGVQGSFFSNGNKVRVSLNEISIH